MNLLPYKHVIIPSNKGINELRETLKNNTESEIPAFYWRRTFNKPLWGKIGEKEFAVRPVVPYWNISSIHIKGFITEEEQSKVKLIITSPYLRIIAPLVIITLILLFFTYWESRQYDMILSIGGAVIAGAYVLVMTPFQIQLNKTLDLFKKLIQ